MNIAKTIFVSCNGTDQSDSFAIRNDNLATLTIYEGNTTVPSKHCTCISNPFILSVNVNRTKRLISSHITGFIPRGECICPNDVECVDCSGGYLAMGSSDGTVRIWRVSDGELVVEQQLHIGSISVVKINPAIWVLFAGSTTGRIGAFPIPELYSSGEPDRIWGIHSLKINDIAISAAGNRIFSASQDKTVKCYDYATDCEIFAVNLPTPVNCLALSHNESILYCGGTDGVIYQIQLTQDGGLQNKLLGHTMEVTDLLISDDDRVLYSCSLDQTVRRWDTSTSQTLNHIETKGIPFALKYLPIIDVGKPSNEDKKVRVSKKKAIENRNQMKKGFPKLQRQVFGNRDEIVSAPAEDVPIISVEEEENIAINEIVKKINEEQNQEHNEQNKKELVIKPPNEEEENLIRIQNAKMFQYILSQQQK